jgi:hypothetical protein
VIGYVLQMSDWAGRTVGFGYDPDGNNTSTAYPDGTEVSATYDLADAETSFGAATGTPAAPGTAILGACRGPEPRPDP